MALPLFQVRLRDKLTIDPLGVRFRIWRSDYCRFLLFAGLSESRSADASSPVSRLPNIDSGMNLGFLFEGRIAGPLAFRVNGRKEVAGGHGGLTLAPSLGVIVRNKSGTYSVIPEVAATWANGSYMQSFFGVTPAGGLWFDAFFRRRWSARSGIAADHHLSDFRAVDDNRPHARGAPDRRRQSRPGWLRHALYVLGRSPRQWIRQAGQDSLAVACPTENRNPLRRDIRQRRHAAALRPNNCREDASPSDASVRVGCRTLRERRVSFCFWALFGVCFSAALWAWTKVTLTTGQTGAMTSTVLLAASSH